MRANLGRSYLPGTHIYGKGMNSLFPFVEVLVWNPFCLIIFATSLQVVFILIKKKKSRSPVLDKTVEATGHIHKGGEKMNESENTIVFSSLWWFLFEIIHEACDGACVTLVVDLSWTDPNYNNMDGSRNFHNDLRKQILL